MQLHSCLAASIGRAMPNGIAKRAVSQGETGHLAASNGLFGKPKRPVLQVVVGQAVRKKGREASV